MLRLHSRLWCDAPATVQIEEDVQSWNACMLSSMPTDACRHAPSRHSAYPGTGRASCANYRNKLHSYGKALASSACHAYAAGHAWWMLSALVLLTSSAEAPEPRMTQTLTQPSGPRGARLVDAVRVGLADQQRGGARVQGDPNPNTAMGAPRRAPGGCCPHRSC